MITKYLKRRGLTLVFIFLDFFKELSVSCDVENKNPNKVSGCSADGKYQGEFLYNSALYSQGGDLCKGAQPQINKMKIYKKPKK